MPPTKQPRSIAPDATTLIRALRRRGDEVQLTRAIGELAQADQLFASGFLRLLLDSAPYAHKVRDRPQTDEDVDCEIERQLIDAAGSRWGRIELTFRAGGLCLCVEVKLHSDYRPDQLRDYLHGIDPGRGEYLLALTRNISRYREPDPGEPGWLGSVRWPQVVEGLRNLATPGPLREQWNALVQVLEEDGDVGLTTLEQQLVTAYETYDDVLDRLWNFLEHLGPSALHGTRAALSERHEAEKRLASFASPRRRSKKTKMRRSDRDEDFPPVITDGGELCLALNIPANGSERLWVGFYVNDDGRSQFYIAAGWSEDAAPGPSWTRNWRGAVVRLRELIGSTDLFVDENYCQIDYPLIDFTGKADVPLALAETVDQIVPTLVNAGLFSGDLPPTSASLA